MAKKQTKETYNDIKQQQQDTSQKYNTLQGTAATQVNQASDRAFGNSNNNSPNVGNWDTLNNADELGNVSYGGSRGPIESGYKNFAATGGVNKPSSFLNSPGQIDTNYAGSLADGSSKAYDYSSKPGYYDFSATGGWSPERTQSIDDNISNLKDFGRTGGLSASGINRMRGNGVFDEFADNGGYTDSNLADIKAQALSPIGAYASNTRDELARRKNVQGGYAPGMDSASRALGRDTARNISEAALTANVNLKDRVNQGRQWGAGNIANAESGIQGLKTGNQLRGMTAANDAEMGLVNSMNGNKLAGLGGLANLDALRQSGMLSGTNMLGQFQGQNIGNQMQTDQFNSNMGLNYDSLIQSGRLAGLGGLSGIYNSDIGQYNNAINNQYDLVGQQAGANAQYNAPRTNLATQPGIGGNLMNLAGGALNVGAGLLSGGAGKPLLTSRSYAQQAIGGPSAYSGGR